MLVSGAIVGTQVSAVYSPLLWLVVLATVLLTSQRGQGLEELDNSR